MMSSVLLLLLTFSSSSLGDCPEDQLDWSSYGYFQTCRSHHIKQALQENVLCRPSPVIVKLPLPNNTDIQQMTPTHVEIMQCSGACHRGNQDCVPTLTKEKEVSVMVGRCGIQAGVCQKECARLVVVEHLQCGCDCSQEARDSCTGQSHVFNSDTCQCQCKDIAAKQECLDQGRSWSASSCSCSCHQPSPCSIGTVFSNVTCTCLPENSILLTRQDNRAARSQSSDPFFTWQLIVILVLLILIFILLVTIFSLISKLQSARRRIKAARLAAQNNQTNNPYDVYAERAKPAVTNKDLVVKTKSGDKFYSQVYCESPSSGFGSEGSKYSNSDLHADNSGYRAPPAPASSVPPGPESMYHTAETVRLNKKIQNNSPHHIYAGSRNILPPENICVVATPGPPVSMMASDPIDEAVRLLEHSAAMLQ